MRLPSRLSSRSIALGRRHLSTQPSGAPSAKVALLAGSAPHYTRHLILSTTQPSSLWPARLEAHSDLLKALTGCWDDDAKIGYGIAYDAPSASRQPSEADSWSGMLYPDFFPVDNITLHSLPSVMARLNALPPPRTDFDSATPQGKVHIFVCTHASRDCRCGVLGTPLYESLLDQVKRRGLTKEEVQVSEVAHVGGHKFAANALVYRQDGACDWYGLLRDSDASRLLTLALNPSTSKNKWFPRYRGSLGLSPAQAKELYSQSLDGQQQGRRTEKRAVLGEEVRKLKFCDWEGENEWELEGWEGESLMEVAKRHDLPSILATCGGHCECATCHVLLSGAEAGNSPPVAEMEEEEEEQLDFALGRGEGSRLACQIPISQELEDWCKRGGVIKLPRY